MDVLIMLRNNIYANYIGYHIKKLANNVMIVNNNNEIVQLLTQKHWDIAIIGIHVGSQNALEVINVYNQYYREQRKNTYLKTKFYILSAVKEKIYGIDQLGIEGYYAMPQNTHKLLAEIIKDDL
jgi:hypothetical protein